MGYLADGLLTFRRHAMKSLPELRWQWRFESLTPEPGEPYVLLEEIDRSVNQAEDLRAVGADGTMEFYEHVKSMVRLMFVSDSPQKSFDMAHRAWRHMRLQSFMMAADYDGIAVGAPTAIQSIHLPDYSGGEAAFKAVAMTTVRVTYAETYTDNLGIISHADAELDIDGHKTTVVINP